MVILVIPSWYITKSLPTNGEFFRRQAIALKNRGNKVIVLNATFTSKSDYFNPENFVIRKEDDNGVIVYSLTFPSLGLTRNPSLLYKLFCRNANKLYKKIIKENGRIDIIHAHSYFPAGVYAAEIKEKFGIPFVITEHLSGVLNKSISLEQQSRFRNVIEKADEIISVSESLKESIIELSNTHRNIYVIPNMVDSAFVYKKKCIGTEFTFFTLGNLDPSKRFDVVIKAFIKAFPPDEHVKLIIGGKGPCMDQLRLLVSKSNDSRITLTGQLSRQEVVKHMQDANCFVFASKYETFGVVYIEALATGTPVISTINNSVGEIVSQEAGIILEGNTIEELSRGMRSMIENYSNYDFKAISEKYKNKYGEEIVADQIMLLFNQCVNPYNIEGNIEHESALFQ